MCGRASDSAFCNSIEGQVDLYLFFQARCFSIGRLTTSLLISRRICMSIVVVVGVVGVRERLTEKNLF